MRRNELLSTFLLVHILVGTAVAQTPGPRPDPSVTFVVGTSPGLPGPRVNVADVVGRILSFDKNKDGKIGKDELPERMQDLVVKGDVNSDGALDEGEITKLATDSPGAGRGGLSVVRVGTERIVVRPAARPGIEGILDDLKLPAAKHAEAMALVQAQQEQTSKSIDASASRLKLAMTAILGAEQLTDFETTLESEVRQRLGGRGVPPPALNGVTLVVRTDLEGKVDRFDLAAAGKAQAQSAIKTYRDETGRVRDSANAELMASLKRVLSDDEWLDFKAASDRLGPARFVVTGPPGPGRGGTIIR